jgi:hypothetical protein
VIPFPASTKAYKTLCIFQYGEHDLLYPESSSPITIGASLGTEFVTYEGKQYTPVPAISIDLPERIGGLGEGECKIQIPTTIRQHATMQSMARALAGTRSTYPVSVKVVQIIRSGADREVPMILYRGRMQGVTRNPRGMQDTVEMDFVSDFHSRIEDISLGRRADATCDMPYGQMCGALPSARMEIFGPGEYYTGGSGHFKLKRNAWVTLTVDSLHPRRVAFALDAAKHTSAPSEPNRTRTLTNQPVGGGVGGLVCRNGLRLPIQEWRWQYGAAQGSNFFILHRTPPEDWDGESVFLRLDCSRDKQACADRNNSDNFGGLGRDIPAYNPTIDLPE